MDPIVLLVLVVGIFAALSFSRPGQFQSPPPQIIVVRSDEETPANDHGLLLIAVLAVLVVLFSGALS